ncbi:MAG: CoA-binding protein [Alphaproteobacteria bacterium]|nr:CoA-binding protein [Alphaproteobacteria bacterium]
MNHNIYSDDRLRGIFDKVRTIAMVGASPNWNRPSYFVMKYLQLKGFRVIPVNPRAAGEIVLGEKVHSSLDQVPDAIDMVDVFRSSKEALGITEQAIAKGAKVIWMQIGISNNKAANLAEKAGLVVVMNRCPKIEYSRLNGELSWGGFNSGIISSKRRRI